MLISSQNVTHYIAFNPYLGKFLGESDLNINPFEAKRFATKDEAVGLMAKTFRLHMTVVTRSSHSAPHMLEKSDHWVACCVNCYKRTQAENRADLYALYSQIETPCVQEILITMEPV